MTEAENPTRIHARFFLRGKGIDPETVTAALKITPSYLFKEGDLFGRRKEHFRQYGFWSFDSNTQVQSHNLEEHILWILDLLESSQSQLDSILLRSDVHAELTIVFHLFTREWSEAIPSTLLNRIAKLNIALGVSFYHLSYPEE